MSMRNIPNKKLKVVFYVFLFSSLFLADRFSKAWALKNLLLKDVALFNGLNLSLAFNRGISFGYLRFNSFYGFVVLTFIIFCIVLAFTFYTIYKFKKGANIFFEVLIIAGAISNLVDRFLYGGVIDFIDCYVYKWHWPIFNLADVFVCVGILGILIRNFYDEPISI